MHVSKNVLFVIFKLFYRDMISFFQFFNCLKMAFIFIKKLKMVHLNTPINNYLALRVRCITMNKSFQDIVEIILIDPYDTKSIFINKHNLEKSRYFNNLFNFGKEKDQSSIRIEAINAEIARKIILIFSNDQKINPGFYRNIEVFIVTLSIY
jgi:hypothetical protein